MPPSRCRPVSHCGSLDTTQNAVIDTLFAICKGELPLDGLKPLLESHPAAARSQDARGRIPLTVACLSQLSDVQPLLDTWPESASVMNWGNHALHHACHCNTTSKVILQILEAWPEAAKTKNRLGNLPLHMVCSNCVPVSPAVVERLVQVWPDSVQVYGMSKELPIDILCRKLQSINPPPRHVIDMLAGDRPPLHFACTYSKSPRTFKFLLNPEALQLRDRDGKLPLHSAVIRRDALFSAFCKVLVKQFPAGISATDLSGNLPLHCACQDRFSRFAIVVFLVEKYPAALQKSNMDGLLAWHLACASKAPLDQVYFLVRSHPELLCASFNRDS